MCKLPPPTQCDLHQIMQYLLSKDQLDVDGARQELLDMAIKNSAGKKKEARPHTYPDLNLNPNLNLP
jgi:hypothetical protein